MAPRTSGIFVTGQPGCGKTYMLRKAYQSLAKRGLKCSGFLTEEVLEKGRRVGFDLVTIPDRKRRPFARKSPYKDWKHRTGDYVVDVNALEEIGVPLLQKAAQDKVDIFVVDEIGRMELHSAQFQRAIKLLVASGHHLLASVAAPRYGHKVPFVESIKKRKGVVNLHLKASIRANVALELQNGLDKMFSPNSCKAAQESSTTSSVRGKKRNLISDAESTNLKRSRSVGKTENAQSSQANTRAISKAMLDLANKRGRDKTC